MSVKGRAIWGHKFTIDIREILNRFVWVKWGEIIKSKFYRFKDCVPLTEGVVLKDFKKRELFQMKRFVKLTFEYVAMNSRVYF